MLTYTKYGYINDDSSQNFRSLSPLDMLELALKRGFYAYAISISLTSWFS